MRQRKAVASGGGGSSLPSPPPPAASDRALPAGESAGGGARPCPSMAFPGALGKSRGRRQHRAGLAQGGGDLGRRPGGDGVQAAASVAPAAGAGPSPAPPARGAGMRLRRCRLNACGGSEAADGVLLACCQAR